jgi:S-formylglutathione hydrolase FrmB
VRRTALLAVLLVAGCGGDDRPPAPRPAERGVAVHGLEVRSSAVGRALDALVIDPRRAPEDAPLLVLLHGQGSSPDSMVAQELLDELVGLGDRAPVVLLPDGDEASYWHDRDGGAWARMVLDEAIPAAAERFGADPRRVAVAGFSMGGFGALHLATRDPGRFCSVAAHSPAVFTSRPKPGSPFAEAFDDDADFRRADPVARARRLPPGTWVDVGDADPFAPAVRRLVERMRRPRYREWRGDHDFSYFVREAPRWLRFHLERC